MSAHIEVVATDEFAEWYLALEAQEASAVNRVVSLLESMGVALRYPYTSAIEGSRHALRELRIQSRGRPLRVLYAFDPIRQAVLLIGGDKTGDERFYERLVPKAEELFDTYLKEREEQEPQP